MMPIHDPAHGGDVQSVARRYGIPAERLLDFSANINPAGLPARAAERLARDARDVRVVTQYPAPDTSELRELLSERLHVPIESIVIGAGADSLIHASVRAMAPRSCLIPIPAFSEYARSCQACGCAIHRVQLDADGGFLLDRAFPRVARPGDLAILNNPHNPTGVGTCRAEMRERISRLRSAGATVLVDEAFVDFAPDMAVTTEAATDTGMIAVRSLTKFFGCAGLRVGYAVAAPHTARSLTLQLPPWPVTTLALNALAEALQDSAYIRDTLARNQQARGVLTQALARLGCRVYPPAANFILIRLPDAFGAAEVRDRLIREHAIIVRDCDSFEGLESARYLRMAVRKEDENARLIEGLACILGERTCCHPA